jgi:hypothetical protein
MTVQVTSLLFKPHRLNGPSDNLPIAPLTAFDASTQRTAVVSIARRASGGFTVPLDRGNYDA